jgi:AraC-like DNA-binding protein
MRTLYLKTALIRGPLRCCVINVSSLLRELVLHACTFSGLTRKVKAQAHVIDLIVDQLAAMEVAPLELTYPRDPRGALVAKMLTDNPNDSSSLEQLCGGAGASKRTIERIFVEETRLTLGRWRQQLRLLRSLHLLAAGVQVSRVALDMGYSTPSAFISMFRKAFGMTPRGYFLAKR